MSRLVREVELQPNTSKMDVGFRDSARTSEVDAIGPYAALAD